MKKQVFFFLFLAQKTERKTAGGEMLNKLLAI